MRSAARASACTGRDTVRASSKAPINEASNATSAMARIFSSNGTKACIAASSGLCSNARTLPFSSLANTND